MAANDLTIVVTHALSGLPLPSLNEEHLCPCFEQIFGAAYAIVAADRYGARTPSLGNYHEDVRLRIPSLLASDQVPPRETNGPLTIWAGGFYFNAALQRIVWSGDRLLVAFARLPANCCPDPPQPNSVNRRTGFGAVLSDTRSRLSHEHLQSASGVRAYFDLLDRKDLNPEEHDVTDNNYLQAIRYDVNEAKHSIGGFRRRSSSKGEKRLWAFLGPENQFHYGVKAFLAVCNLYSEMHRIYFVDKLLLPQAG